jgi:hypothetical protein
MYSANESCLASHSWTYLESFDELLVQSLALFIIAVYFPKNSSTENRLPDTLRAWAEHSLPRCSHYMDLRCVYPKNRH